MHAGRARRNRRGFRGRADAVTIRAALENQTCPSLRPPRYASASMTRHDFASLARFTTCPLFDLISRRAPSTAPHWPEQRSPALHPAEHQDRRLQRGLLLLRPKRPLRHRPGEGDAAAARRSPGDGRARAAPTAAPASAWARRGRASRRTTPSSTPVLETVREVSKLGMEVCVTLGQLTPEAARQLREAGVTAYNHNLDTSPEFYPQIVTTHTFEDRLDTIRSVQKAGMSVCCGGIIGMGETEIDRLKMLEVLCGFDPAPESVPINCLMPMPGTPLAEQAAGRYLPARAPDRHHAHRAAQGPRPPLRRPHPAHAAKARRSASSPAPTPFSTATSSSPPPTPARRRPRAARGARPRHHQAGTAGGRRVGPVLTNEDLVRSPEGAA